MSQYVRNLQDEVQRLTAELEKARQERDEAKTIIAELNAHYDRITANKDLILSEPFAHVYMAGRKEVIETAASVEAVEAGARNAYAKCQHTNGPYTLAQYAGQEIMDAQHKMAGYVVEGVISHIRSKLGDKEELT